MKTYIWNQFFQEYEKHIHPFCFLVCENIAFVKKKLDFPLLHFLRDPEGISSFRLLNVCQYDNFVAVVGKGGVEWDAG